MAIALGKGCHDAATFRGSHALAVAPGVVPVGGQYVVGPGFFTTKTKSELQLLVDNTWKNRKKLNFTGANAAAAKTVLESACSDSNTSVTVRWGLHQPENRPAGTGSCLHFTVIGNPNDWHMYVNSDGSRIGFMSNGAGPGNLVTIKKW